MMQYFRFQLSLLLTFSCFQINAQKYLKAVVCLKDSSYKEVVIEFSKSIFDTLICKDSTNNSFFTPSNILSFTTGTRNFIAIHPQRNLDNLPAKSFFVEQLVDGKAQLYSYSGKYFGQNELYLFRKKGEKQLYAVNKKIKNEGNVLKNSW